MSDSAPVPPLAPVPAPPLAFDRDVDLPQPASRWLGEDPSGRRSGARYRWQAATREVHGELWFGPGAEGLPGHVHGGAVASACDEAMGLCAWMTGYVAAGVRVCVDHRRALVPGSAARLVAKVERVEGRKVYASAEVTAEVGVEAGIEASVVARAEGVFVAIEPRDWAPFAGWPGRERFTG